VIPALTVFVFIGLFTPGPNVILLTASGARFGFMATLPHLGGVVIGVGLIAAVTSLGIGPVLNGNPLIKFVLQFVSTLWILWIAWRFIQATPHTEKEIERPFTFVQAVAFQVVNPKIWAFAIAASAGFSTLNDPFAQAVLLAANFSGLNLFICAFWTMFGTLLAKLLSSPRAWAIFRNIMATLLAASSGLIWI
jgi:threonine/homoserine/homoserine lactone efflux protein